MIAFFHALDFNQESLVDFIDCFLIAVQGSLCIGIQSSLGCGYNLPFLDYFKNISFRTFAVSQLFSQMTSKFRYKCNMLLEISFNPHLRLKQEKLFLRLTSFGFFVFHLILISLYIDYLIIFKFSF